MDTMIIVVLLCGPLLMIFGALMGHSLSQYLMIGDLRRHTKLRREIGEQWRELAAERERRDRSRCPHCGEMLGAEDSSDSEPVKASA